MIIIKGGVHCFKIITTAIYLLFSFHSYVY